MGVLLLSPVALAACSAGQVTQTATQEQNLGNSADVGQLHLRALELPYPTGGVYPSGSDARLLGAIASDAATDDTLVSIEGEQFESVEVVDPGAATGAAAGAGSGSLGLTVPAGGTRFIGNGTGPSITLVGLTEDLGVGDYVDVRFSFEQAGEVTVAVPVGTAGRDLPRGDAFDFHGDEESTPSEGGEG
jgi:copper(I)-binding protein